MNIQLVPHEGMAHGKRVVLDQYQIMLDGVRVGYVGKSPGSIICPIRAYPDDVMEAIRQHVAEHVGGDPKVGKPPPPPGDPVEEVDDDLEDGEDDDDDDE